MSKQIKLLEDELGEQLFVCSTASALWQLRC
ncbi:hypothetical protein [Eikenella sp. NML03-A-027]